MGVRTTLGDTLNETFYLDLLFMHSLDSDLEMILRFRAPDFLIFVLLSFITIFTATIIITAIYESPS